MNLGYMQMENAVAQLSQSAKGRHAMRHLLKWLDEGGVSLDGRNQEAVLKLLSGIWGPYAGTGRDLMRNCLDDCSVDLHSSELP